MAVCPDAEVIGAVKRGTKRAAAVVHWEMKRGLRSLATISSVAPLVGVAGTLWGILNSFPGCGAASSTCMAAVFERLSQSLAPTALSFLVALPAFWCYKYLWSQVETFDLEMENASVQLVNCLMVHLGRRRQLQPS